MKAQNQPFTRRQIMLKNQYEIYRYHDAHLSEVALHHHDFYEVYFSIKEERRVIFFSWVVVLMGCFAMMTGVEDSLGYKGPINTEKYIPVFALVTAGCLLDLIMTFVRRRRSRNGAGSGE